MNSFLIKKFFLVLFFSLSFSLVTAQEDQAEKEKDYHRNFVNQSQRDHYIELTLTNEKLIRLKAFEPLDSKKIAALVYLRVISKEQSTQLIKHLDKKGIILLPELTEALSKHALDINKIVDIVRLYPGPYKEDTVEKLEVLGLLNENEKEIFLKLLKGNNGYLPGVPPEAPVIVVQDNWNGVPLDSYGNINSSLLIQQNFHKDSLPDKLTKLIEKHRDYLMDLKKESDIKLIKDAKNIHKAQESSSKRIAKIMEKMHKVEADIAQEKHLMSYLYLAGIYQVRYDGNIEVAKDIKTDRNNLLQSLLTKTDKSNKMSVIDKNRILFDKLEKFIAVDKTLQWLTNKTTPAHRELAKSALMLLLQGHGHPPWDADDKMWFQWWQITQKDFYITLVGEPKKN